MTRHLTKTDFGQCRCLWCGAHPRHPVECRVTVEIRQTIATFAVVAGRTWKSKLRTMWETGDYENHPDPQLLQQYRNIAGSRLLSKVTPQMLKAVPR